jgi:hypothetical protein
VTAAPQRTKAPTVASQKKVTADNIARLGLERLAALLAEAAAARPELKRRLRMELAAEQGADHLAAEIDKRLASLESSRGKVSWRQRPTFVRDLEGLRSLIADRLAGLDGPAALGRLWMFMGVARRVQARMRDRDGELAAVFARAARDIGALVEGEDHGAAAALAEAIVAHPVGWSEWLPEVLASAPPGLAGLTLRRLADAADATAGRMPLLRQLARAAGEADALQATYTAAVLRTPAAAADVARSLLAAGRIGEAGRLLKAAAPDVATPGRAPAGVAGDATYEWESAWIDYLEAAGEPETAQAARWASFERTLSTERARAFTTRLTGFDDVVAEERAFARAAEHPEFERGLQFLMEWPAFAEAARMIQARPEDIHVVADKAELWAGRLQGRHADAAHLLLRKAAAVAFRRRDLATCNRLTAAADALDS